MNIRGTETWRGRRPNPVSMKQKVYFTILESLTGKKFSASNSREAYAMIGRYKKQIENNVDIEYCLDADDPYVFYSDVYIYKQYRFTIESRCRTPIGKNDTIDTASIISFKTYEDASFV